MENKYNYLLNFITNLQAEGRYTFPIEELRQKGNIEGEALKKSLNRLSRKGNIVSVRKGFYVIVPPEYSAQKLFPPPLFIDDLMQYIQKRYYVGLLSAAALHGAAHQQPQELQVITKSPALRNINVKQNRITFFSKRKFIEHGIETRKTDTGYVKISGPELTAIDLVQFEQRIGGLNRVLSVLYELTEECQVEKMRRLLSKTHFQKTSLQRLGYLLQTNLNQTELADAIFDTIEINKFFRISLITSKPKRKVKAKNRWKVADNSTIESEF